MKEELKKELKTFLDSQFIMTVAVSHQNKPAASVLLFVVDDDLNFYFATHTNSYKAQYLIENPQISICVWEHNKMLIQADGNAKQVEDNEEQLSIIERLAESSAKGEDFWPPLLRIKGENYIVFKIKPNWIRKLDLTVNTMTQDSSPFEELLLN